jgi:hypothetical protein
VFYLVGTDRSLETQLVSYPSGKRPAHIDGGLGADGDHADFLEVTAPAAESSPGGLRSKLDHPVAGGAEGHLVTTQADGVFLGILAP